MPADLSDLTQIAEWIENLEARTLISTGIDISPLLRQSVGRVMAIDLARRGMLSKDSYPIEKINHIRDWLVASVSDKD